MWNKQIFFAQNITLEPVGCTAFDLAYDSSPCYAFDVGATGDTSAQSGGFGLWFSSDGTKLYTGSFYSPNLHQYALNTAWDLSDGMSFTQTKVLAGTTCYEFNFSPDGTKLIVCDRNSNNHYMRTFILSSAWDISTATLSASTSNTLGWYFFGFGLVSGGTVLIGMRSGINYFYKYTLSTPWDMSTRSALVDSYDNGSVYAHQYINEAGTRMYDSATINQLNLGTPYDLQSITEPSTAGFNAQISGGDGVYFKADGSIFYQIDNGSGIVYQYSYTGT